MQKQIYFEFRQGSDPMKRAIDNVIETHSWVNMY